MKQSIIVSKARARIFTRIAVFLRAQIAAAVAASRNASNARLGLAIALLALASACGGGRSPAPPSGLSYPTPQMYPTGKPITALTPTVTGSVNSYSVAPGLPPGLSIDATSGAISGIPTTATATADYAITAQNAGGSATFKLSIAIITVTASPANLARIVAAGTPVTMSVSVTPVDFAWAGTLTAKAADTAGVFSPSVTVAATSDGTYSLTLTTSTTVAADHYSNSVTISLCSDASCATPQPVPSISVPFDVTVLSASSLWPGNHLTPLSAWVGVSEWSTFQGNSAHTGYVPADVDPNQFSTRWQGPTLTFNDGFEYQNCVAVTTSNGMLFVAGSTDPNLLATTSGLFALNELDGSPVWQHSFGSTTYQAVNSPAVFGGVVYISAGEFDSDALFAFNAADGSLMFQSPMTSANDHHLAPTIGPGGIYVNEADGVYGFGLSGVQLFVDSLAQTSEWTPATDANAIYAYTGKLTVIDPSSGAVLASIADPTFTNYVYEIGGSPVLGAPGSVIAANYANASVGALTNTLLDFNVPQKSINWQLAGSYVSTPAYNAGVLYAANDNPFQLEARAETDGSLLWSWVPPQVGDATFVSEVLLTKTMVFVSTNLAVYGIDMTTHDLVWSYPLPGRLALSPNGILYIEASGMKLTAINLK
jgi:PQQ-like domain/Putative Ig domain